jgi:hypothetical protein
MDLKYQGAGKSLALPTSLSIVFSFQGTGGSRMGPDPENRVGDQDTGSPSRTVSSGLQVPSEPGREPGYCGAASYLSVIFLPQPAHSCGEMFFWVSAFTSIVITTPATHDVILVSHVSMTCEALQLS